MNRYIVALENANATNRNLIDKLAQQRAQPLSLDEKAIIRAALIPRVRENLEGLFLQFVAGNDPMDCPAARELREIFDDLGTR